MQLRNSHYWLFSWKLQSPLLLGFPPAGLNNLQKYVSALYAMHLKQMYLDWKKVKYCWFNVSSYFIMSAISLVKYSQVLTFINWLGLIFQTRKNLHWNCSKGGDQVPLYMYSNVQFCNRDTNFTHVYLNAATLLLLSAHQIKAVSFFSLTLQTSYGTS